jgi:putative transposase
MPRKKRDRVRGLFHITCHAVWTSDLFRDDIDRIEFLRELATTVRRFNWGCVSYCLMDTHAHFIVGVGDDALPNGMQQLNMRYACRYNQRHRLRGHVFGGRYDSRRIETDAHLKTAFAYDANNPRDAGACDSAADWPWSSYRGTVGLDELASFVDPSPVLRLFGDDRETAIGRLRRFVEGS